MIIATTIPLYIYVDEDDEGQPYVSKVVADDESLDLSNPDLQDDNGNALKASNYTDGMKTVRVIENSEWPSWEFGF